MSPGRRPPRGPRHRIAGIVFSAAVLGLGLAGAGPGRAQQIGLLGGWNSASLGDGLDGAMAITCDLLRNELGGTWTYGSSRRAGLFMGAFTEFRISPAVAFRPEIAFAQRGTGYRLDGSGSFGQVGSKVRFKMDYVETALLFAFRVAPPKSGGFAPAVFAGPMGGVKTSARLSMDVLGQSSSTKLGGMNASFFGAVGGVELARVGPHGGSVFVQGRYTLGITNLVDDSSVESKPRDIAILLGATFRMPD
ncbi:MAG: PorT family protein [Candidatus Eisenbacteria bacterium]|nr:PorT family protein [Candidatus Eisenbacteria bacterium]